jgi:hypothetical protein
LKRTGPFLLAGDGFRVCRWGTIRVLVSCKLCEKAETFVSQIFTASADTWLRAFALIVVAGLLLMSVVVAGGYTDSSYVTLVG